MFHWIPLFILYIFFLYLFQTVITCTWMGILFFIFRIVIIVFTNITTATTYIYIQTITSIFYYANVRVKCFFKFCCSVLLFRCVVVSSFEVQFNIIKNKRNSRWKLHEFNILCVTLYIFVAWRFALLKNVIVWHV